MKRIAFLILLLAGFVLGATLLAAAQGETTSVQGVVVDDQGKPVEGAVLNFHATQTGASFSTKTDKKGEFVRLGVKSDVYVVTVTKDGQTIAQLPQVQITLAGNPPIKITAGKPAAPAPAAPVSSFALTPAQKQALEALQKQAAAAPKKDDKAEKEKLDKAQAALAAKKFDEAMPLFTEVTTMDPMSDAGWSGLGYCYAQAGKNDQALPAFENAVAINPNFGGYHQNLAIAYAKVGKVEEALAELAAAGQVDAPNAPRYYLYTGLLLAQVKRSTEALAAFDKAIAADPKLADAYFFKGLTLMDQAQQPNGKLTAPPGAAEAFKKYLELQPNGPRAAAARQQLTKLGG